MNEPRESSFFRAQYQFSASVFAELPPQQLMEFDQRQTVKYWSVIDILRLSETLTLCDILKLFAPMNDITYLLLC